MHAPTDNVPPSRPFLMRLLVRSWEYRHPRGWARFRSACGIWNLFLGILLLASVPWTGPLAILGLLPLAGATPLFWTANRLQTSVQS